MRENLEKSIFCVAVEKFKKCDIEKLSKIVDNQENILKLNQDRKDFFKLDNKFHSTVFGLCGFKNICGAIQNISQDYNRFRLLDSMSKVNNRLIIKQHMDLIKAIDENDYVLFNKVMSEHLRNLDPQIDTLKNKYLDYFL